MLFYRMTSSVVGSHTSGSGPLSLMSCVRESSPQDLIHDSENDKIGECILKFFIERASRRASSKFPLNHVDFYFISFSSFMLDHLIFHFCLGKAEYLETESYVNF